MIQPEIIEMDVVKLETLLRRAEEGAFEKEDYQTIRDVLESYYYVTQLIDQKSTTIARLRKLLFGAPTEKTADVIGRDENALATGGEGDNPAPAARPDSPSPTSPTPQPKKGHGRNGADDYPGADRVRVPHASLQPGDSCPECPRGTVYEVARPGVVIRFGRPLQCRAQAGWCTC